MKQFIGILLGIVLTGCITNEVPARVSNTYEVAGKVYCDTAIFSNVERMVVRWLQATVAPEWTPVCSEREVVD